eukprot:1847020-Rhodomonas_salina.2
MDVGRIGHCDGRITGASHGGFSGPILAIPGILSTYSTWTFPHMAVGSPSIPPESDRIPSYEHASAPEPIARFLIKYGWRGPVE